MTQLISLFTSAVTFGTIIMFGALGEILTEKVGHLNLGVPGIMYMGGISGLLAAFFYQNAGGTSPILGLILSLLACFLGAALGGLIYAFLTITLRANQNVTGLTLTIFGGGVANFFGGSLNALSGGVGQISVALTAQAYRVRIPVLSDAGVIGKLFFSYGFMAYLAIIMAVVMSYFLNRTRPGLHLRAVGENPGTADAAGINVTKYKYLTTCIGAGISGLGGVFYVMDYIKGTWANDGILEGLGWLAVALVIFATWKPLRAIWASYLFGLVYWAYMYIPGLGRSSQEIFKMLPYVVTLVVLIIVSLRKKRENQPPAALGLSYFREER
ncbi:MAG: ABC transporter permease [Clostridiales bacterium]|nr:ABC transporter permease [Candidatus Cacconaster stercorequi]